MSDVFKHGDHCKSLNHAFLLQQLEPVVGDPASSPLEYTNGLEYVGYGELYLDILAAATSKDKSQYNIFDYLYGKE
jgi:hypothetical protein